MFRSVPAICIVVALPTAIALWATEPAESKTNSNADQAVSALLLQKTQEFSDAGQSGNGASMGALVDDRVVFFNEEGDTATRRDIASSTPSPSSAFVKTTMRIDDWRCEIHGDVAVTSFIDDQRRAAGEEVFHARYRSVETWLQENGRWKMIGSETIALIDDPRTVALSASELSQYVGSYRNASGQEFTFSMSGSQLMAATAVGAPSVQGVEVRDVLFTPGHARVRKVFERDHDGRVVGFFARREGHNTRFARIG